jgi:hypothetical protein
MRPQRGSRDTSTTGASTCDTPRARVWRAVTVKTSSARPGSKLAARAMAWGKLVAPGPTRPCRASSCKIAGIPRRVCSTRNFWMALASSVASRGESSPKGSAFFVKLPRRSSGSTRVSP